MMIIALNILSITGFAQEKEAADQPLMRTKTFKISKTVTKIYIDLGNSIIEGHSGNDIIISSQVADQQNDEKSKGLKSINGTGLEDNTGMGINVDVNEGTVKVSELNWTDPAHKKILVPNTLIIAFDLQKRSMERITFKNIQNELEISTLYNPVILENITGPVVVKSLHGNIDATFSQTVKGPLSFVTINGHIDLTLPSTINSDLKMRTLYGEFLVSPELKIEIQKQGQKNVNNNQVNGKINGGGFNIDLRTDVGKIYLRTK